MYLSIHIVNDTKNFVSGPAKAAIHGFGRSREQKFVMSFIIFIALKLAVVNIRQEVFLYGYVAAAGTQFDKVVSSRHFSILHFVCHWDMIVIKCSVTALHGGAAVKM